jgi:hypothetical protein
MAVLHWGPSHKHISVARFWRSIDERMADVRRIDVLFETNESP